MDTSRGSVTLRLPDGSTVELPDDATIGNMRSNATLRLEGSYVSREHAYLSPRPEITILRGRGEVFVDGRSVSEAVLRPGQTIELPPRLFLAVVAVRPSGRVEPPTGRFDPGTRWTVLPGLVRVKGRGEPVELLGKRAALVTAVLQAPGKTLPLAAVYEAVWPGETGNEGIRARFDDLKKRVNEQLGSERVTIAGSVVRLEWRAGDYLQ